MTNPTPIETLLAKLEKLNELTEREDHPAILAAYIRSLAGATPALIEAFREVLRALYYYREVYPEFYAFVYTARAREALARANEIASQALGETKP